MRTLSQSLAIAAFLLGGCSQSPGDEKARNDALLLKMNGEELARANAEMLAGTPHKAAIDCVAAMANLEQLRALEDKKGASLAGEIEVLCGLQLPLAIARPQVLAAESEKRDRPKAEFYAECMNPHYKMAMEVLKEHHPEAAEVLELESRYNAACPDG